ncbi:transposase [uncultured Desulfatiglans sp.]|nr:transposase [uncultured Desulfatiglans sp.]
MLALSAVTHIYLYRSACDMRRSFDGLCGLIRSELRADPLSGSLFVFCNRRRTMVKILYFEGDGLAIWMKRLERGCFSLPQLGASDGRIDRRQLMLLLEGVTPKKVSKRYVYQ